MAVLATHHPSNKVLYIDEAVSMAVNHAKRYGLTKSQEGLLESCVLSIPKVDVNGVEMVHLNDLVSFLSNMYNAVKAGDFSFLLQKRGLVVSRVVDVEEFVESTQFMGQKGHIRPAIKRDLLRLFETDDYVEAVLTGAIGIGKNYFADMAMAYMLYRLSCFHNPQIEYELAPGSSIVFIMQSITQTLAKKVLFGQFAERIRLSPYFKKYFPFDTQISSELRFPKGITVLPVGGMDTAAIGMNVFGGAIDELNFMARTEDSRYIREDEDMFDQAERVYRSLIRRMKSRFMQKGKLPGKLVLVSSVNYPGDFTDRKIDESKTDPSIFVMKMAAWEALPSDRFSGRKFLVEVGNEIKMSRIIESMEDAVAEEDVIEVPVEYKIDFERDIDISLREVGGIATCSSHPFIPYRELIVKAQEEFDKVSEYRQLFKVESCILSRLIDSGDPYAPDWENVIDLSYLDDCILDPSVVFAVHIDVGITQDAAGIAVGRISGDKMLSSAIFFDDKSKEFREVKDLRMPFYQIDGLLQIKPPPGGEVDLELLRDLVMYLRGRLNIKWATMDSYQSTMMIQAFRKMRIRSGVLSVDQSLAPYAELKQAIKDERILFPTHAVAAKELRELEKNKKEKIDHPPQGSKDVSDAMAGVVYMLQMKEAVYGRSVKRRRRPAIVPTSETQVRRIRIGKYGRR